MYTKSKIWTFAIIAFIIGLAAGGGICIGIEAIVASSGAVDVAADQPRGKLDNFLNYVMERSVEHSAEKMTQPLPNDESKIMHAAHDYGHMCLKCHGAPGGVEGDELLAKHTNPKPPELWEKGTQSMTDGEIFWIVKHGIRFTGMPAVGEKESDEDLRTMVAFIRRLPSLSQDERDAMMAGAGKSGQAGGQPQQEHQQPENKQQQGGA